MQMVCDPEESPVTIRCVHSESLAGYTETVQRILNAHAFCKPHKSDLSRLFNRLQTINREMFHVMFLPDMPKNVNSFLRIIRNLDRLEKDFDDYHVCSDHTYRPKFLP